MLTLNDGRNELWQWDTGRTLTVDAECSQVHFSNKVFGRSIDVDVIDGVAAIPDILLQTDKELTAWAFVGTAENGYTKISKEFKVNRRNKPADYVFTPHDQTTLGEIVQRLEQLEAMQDPDAIKDAVDDYLASNPIQVEETDPTVPAWAKADEKPKYTAQEVGALPSDTKIPNVDGFATEQYVNDKIAGIKIPELPAALPNPHKLTFTGAASAEYDGSEDVEVEIPAGGGASWRLLYDVTTTEDVSSIECAIEPVKEIFVAFQAKLTSDSASAKTNMIYINGKNVAESTSIFNDNIRSFGFQLQYTGSAAFGTMFENSASEILSHRTAVCNAKYLISTMTDTVATSVKVSPDPLYRENKYATGARLIVMGR